MDVNTFIQIVNGVGFPIAACIAMAVFIVWDKKNHRTDRKESLDKQQEMFTKLQESVDNNTHIIKQLIDKLDKEGE